MRVSEWLSAYADYENGMKGVEELLESADSGEIAYGPVDEMRVDLAHEGERLLPDAADVVRAALEFGQDCSYALADNAERFTCTEVEIIERLLRALGLDDTADTIMECHAAGDSELEEDAHVGWTRQ